MLYLCLRAQTSRPRTPSAQPCGRHGSRVAGPAFPARSSPAEEITCQRVSSHPSVFLIFFLPVCTSELVYLRGVTFHQCTGSGLALVLFLNPPSPGLTHHHLFPARRAAAALLLFCSHSIIYPHFFLVACFFSFTTQQSPVCLILSISLFALHSGFSLPTFLSYASAWS